MRAPWSLICSACAATRPGDGLPTVCECGSPWLVRYHRLPPPEVATQLADRAPSMWRYREWLPLGDGEDPITLGEGLTPLRSAPRLRAELDLPALWVKDESHNPTGSFKARGLAAAVTRAKMGGARALVVPTAGNAGVALSAYGQRAGIPVKVFAPSSTPLRIREQIRRFGAALELVDGHIGDCGGAARTYAAQTGAFDVSTLREPYRIEGKKTLALELAEQLGWRLPHAIVYPTGGGTGLIGMWKGFNELRQAGWVTDPPPRLFGVQSSGCAPLVAAFERGAERTDPWPEPQTVALGLQVPAPLGGALVLRAVRETGGGALAVSDEALLSAQRRLAEAEGIDACPEAGAALAGLDILVRDGIVERDAVVVLFNTGAGWLYRED